MCLDVLLNAYKVCITLDNKESKEGKTFTLCKQSHVMSFSWYNEIRYIGYYCYTIDIMAKRYIHGIAFIFVYPSSLIDSSSPSHLIPITPRSKTVRSSEEDSKVVMSFAR